MPHDAIQVAVTGHRALAAPDQVAEGVTQAIGEIQRRFPDHKLVLISGLAEDADRLVVERGLLSGADHEAVLPMPITRYETSFSSDES